jgi:hypothetical protein
MSRYVITSHRNRPGVRLSKPGHWGNEPFDDETQARDYAALDAAGPHSIEREHINKVLRP